MPRRDPFTKLCQVAASLHAPVSADLHGHTTASDGDYTPSQFVALARKAKLNAVAVTDHDTVAGIAEAVKSCKEIPVEVVPGIELSVEFRGREVHLLGLFIDPQSEELIGVCQHLMAGRRQRFDRYLAALHDRGLRIPGHLIDACVSISASLGRRHVANLLIQAGIVRTRHDAFAKHLSAVRDSIPPKHLVPMAEAIRLIRIAGGLSILAHPPGEFDRAVYRELAGLGLNGIEANSPGASNTQRDFLAAMAVEHDLIPTGGSDCHGPDSGDRSLGSLGLSAVEFTRLKEFAGRVR